MIEWNKWIKKSLSEKFTKETMNKEETIREILDNLKYLFDAHDGFAVLAEMRDNTAIIYCGGECSGCDSKCIEEAIKVKIPDIEVIVR